MKFTKKKKLQKMFFNENRKCKKKERNWKKNHNKSQISKQINKPKQNKKMVHVEINLFLN